MDSDHVITIHSRKGLGMRLITLRVSLSSHSAYGGKDCMLSLMKLVDCWMTFVPSIVMCPKVERSCNTTVSCELDKIDPCCGHLNTIYIGALGTLRLQYISQLSEGKGVAKIQNNYMLKLTHNLSSHKISPPLHLY